MEDILDLYQQPFNDSFPVICMDEKPQQLLGETRDCIPMKPGEPQKQDGEYIRNGDMLHIYVYGTIGWLATCNG